ncbi:MAG: hypothetical protein IT371_16450 [Deltaproteobacteria bacterium]|nr:hypothetical protein [Deltaproteobacteria bacterium]
MRRYLVVGMWCALLGAVAQACADPSSPGGGPGAGTTIDPGTTGKRVRGLASRADDGRTILFFSEAADLSKHLQETLAGVERDELWVRAEVPTELLPPAGARLTVDLATDQKVVLVMRRPWALLMSSGVEYKTLTLAPRPGLTTGDLIIRGPAAAGDPMGKPGAWSFAFNATYTGPVTLGGKLVPKTNARTEFGAVYDNAVEN